VEPLLELRGRTSGHKRINQCCHSVMKKNPRFYLEKKPENNKKKQTYKMFKKSQNQTRKARYRYLHIKIKVIYISCIIFLTSSSMFLNILTRPATGGGQSGNCPPPEICKNVCICLIQQHVTSFCPPRKYQLAAALILTITIYKSASSKSNV